MTGQVGGGGWIFALIAAARRALRWCGNPRQRSKRSNRLFWKGSLTIRIPSRIHDRHVLHPNRRSARNPGCIPRRLRELHEPCIPRLYAAASLKREFGLEHLTRFDGCIPRLYAAASLKPLREFVFTPGYKLCIPRLYAAASLKLYSGHSGHLSYSKYSAALCRGLIEAAPNTDLVTCGTNGIPRLYAAASLKQRAHQRARAENHAYSAALCRGLIEAETPLGRPLQRPRYSAALCRGLIEACLTVSGSPRANPYSAALCRGLIEAGRCCCRRGGDPHRIPRLYAAASLKPGTRQRSRDGCARRIPRLYAAASLKHAHFAPTAIEETEYSAALCRGLIEAPAPPCSRQSSTRVFRGFMPRPH